TIADTIKIVSFCGAGKSTMSPNVCFLTGTPLILPSSTCCTETRATVPDGGNVGPSVITMSCGVKLIIFIANPPSFLLLELFDDGFNETVEVSPLVLAHVYKFIVHHCIPFIIRLIRVLDHVPVDFIFSVGHFQKFGFFHLLFPPSICYL